MQLTITQSNLATMVAGFRKIVKRTSLPVLDHVKFTIVSDETATAEMTNLDETLVFTLADCKPQPDGNNVFLCPFQALAKAAKDTKKDTCITLAADPGFDPLSLVLALCFDGRSIETSVPTLAPDEFPATLHNIAVEPAPLASFLTAYRRVAVFASPDPSRAVLNAVFWDSKESSLAATDGRRLGTCAPEPMPLPGDLILPQSKFIRTVSLPESGGRIGSAVDSNDTRWLAVELGPWFYQTRCLPGTYPNYKQVIPPASSVFTAAVQFAKEDLALLKNTMAQFTDDTNSYVYLYACNEAVTILSYASDPAGRFRYVTLPNSRCSLADGTAPVVHALTAEYLMQGLEAGYLQAHIPSEMSPWRFTDGRNVYALMPCREADTTLVADFVQRTVIPNLSRTEQLAPAPAASRQKDAVSYAKADAPATKPVPAPQPEPAPKRQTPGIPVGLKIVPKETPFEQLQNEIGETQELLRQLGSRLSSIKAAAKAAERDMKDRSKEFQNTRKVLAALKEAAGF